MSLLLVTGCTGSQPKVNSHIDATTAILLGPACISHDARYVAFVAAGKKMGWWDSAAKGFQCRNMSLQSPFGICDIPNTAFMGVCSSEWQQGQEHQNLLILNLDSPDKESRFALPGGPNVLSQNGFCFANGNTVVLACKENGEKKGEISGLVIWQLEGRTARRRGEIRFPWRNAHVASIRYAVGNIVLLYVYFPAMPTAHDEENSPPGGHKRVPEQKSDRSPEIVSCDISTDKILQRYCQ